MDKLKAITVFRRVVELGSFSAAADDLSLSKAAISKNINELEAYLKSPLIYRTTRKMHVTESGQQYYDHVRTILDEWVSADLSIIESSQQLSGLLRINIPMSVSILMLNPAICEFMKQYPEISVEVVMNDQYIDLVEQGIDIAIRGGQALTDSTLRSRKLTTMDRVLCASPSYLTQYGTPTTPQQLILHNCLVYSLSSSATRWTFSREDDTQVVNIQKSNYSVNNGLALKQAALAGLGIMILPEVFVAKEINSGELLPLLPDWKISPHALYAVYPYHKAQSQKVRVFIDFLTSYLKYE
ncbi:transcriptional regulator [Pseudoalteromonas sp. BMB]|uniref:LysR family transcriptional regulator n=1 Tax=Pseudoalteromonas sp. BMB TaxID=1874619 RepID=UPI00083D0912|nr:LysR family transcriptional regulator [Pseudoalteromonas sp. BMB]ODB35327.1 transcriptional regulator [Pseudoalteromonas sp. BMB]